MPPHLSEIALAERWSVSPRTLQRWRHLGIGPGFIRLRRRIVYPSADVEAFEAAHRTAPQNFVNLMEGTP